MPTDIEWADETWNPTRGCELVSPGCKNCYAMRFAHRFSGKGKPYDGLTRLTKTGPVWTGEVRIVGDALDAPIRWREPRRIFVNSMSDLFHDDVTDEQIAAVFGVMAACPQHTFQILTKRAERLPKWFEWASAEAKRRDIDVIDLVLSFTNDPVSNLLRACIGDDGEHWPLPNVHLGVSVENQKYADERIPHLLDTPAVVRFVSYEPALGPVDFFKCWTCDGTGRSKGGGMGCPDCDRTGRSDAWATKRSVDGRSYPTLSWIIVGGESGPGARPMHPEWARSVVRQCRDAGCAAFVKQMGAWRVKRDGETTTSPTGWGVLGLDGEWVPTGTPWNGRTGADSENNEERMIRVGGHGGDMNEWPEDLRVRQFPEVQQ